jgi:WD40 repeat protein
MSDTPVEMEGHGRTINVVKYAADGSMIFTGGDDNITRIWDASTSTEISALEGHTSSVRDLDVTSDGATLVTGGYDRFFRIWDVASASETFTSEELNGSVYALDISPDDAFFITGDDRGNLQAWELSGAARWTVELPDGIDDLAIKPDGSVVAVASSDESVRIFDAASGAEQLVVWGHTHDSGGATINPDNSLIVAGYNDDLARMWDVATGAEVWVNEGYGITDSNQLSVSFSPDGTVIASDEGFGVYLRDVASGDELAYLDTQSLSETFAFSPDSQLIAVGDWDGILQVYNVADGALLFETKAHNGILSSISFSADGSLIVTAADDGAVRWGGIRG